MFGLRARPLPHAFRHLRTERPRLRGIPPRAAHSLRPELGAVEYVPRGRRQRDRRAGPTPMSRPASARRSTKAPPPRGRDEFRGARPGVLPVRHRRCELRSAAGRAISKSGSPGRWFSTALTRAGCATACSFAASGSPAGRSTAWPRAAGTSTRSSIPSGWDRSPASHAPSGWTTTPASSPNICGAIRGGRVRVAAIAVQVNVIRQPKALEGQRRTALDASLTYSIRF